MPATGPITSDSSSIDHLTARIQDGWRSDSAWIDDWHPGNPSRGQCGSSALVVQDERGGALMRGLVEDALGVRRVHYWNVLDSGWLDVTWSQFGSGARIVRGERVERHELLTSDWFVQRYQALRARVA